MAGSNSEIGSLPLFHQITGQSVLVLGEGATAEPKRRLVERAGGIVIDDAARAVDEGVRIAFVAFEDARACEIAAINLRCAGMLVNVVDRPDLCDFTTPSLLDRHPLLIAIGTGGASAGLAKHIRLRLERILPQSLGRLADALYRVRPTLRKRLPDGADRRRAIDAALEEGSVLDPMDAHSHGRVEEWARGSFAGGEASTVAFVLTSADPEDLTVRQARMLGIADAVCAQGPVPPAILSRARADAARFVCDIAECPSATRMAAVFGGDQPVHCPKAATAVGNGQSRLTVILRYQPDR